MKRITRILMLLACLGSVCAPLKTIAQEVVAAWDMNGVTAAGVSPFSAAVTSPNVTVGGLTRGAGVTVPASGAAGRAWGGTGWNVTDAAAAISADKTVSFTVAPNVGFRMSFASIERFDYRRSGTGAVSGVLQYSTGSGFSDITTLSYASSASAGASLGPIDLSSIGALQNVAAGTTVTFRIVNYGASGAAGTWYIYDVANTTEADLSVRATVTPDGGGGTPPTITTFAPTSGAPGTVVTITGTNFGASPTVSFNGVAAPGATVNGAGTSISVAVPAAATTGPITVTAAGSATSVDTFTVVALPALTLTLSGASMTEDGFSTASVSIPAPLGTPLTVNLSSSDTTEATVPATVTIGAGVTDSDPFTITGIPDSVFDADATVSITASATGYVSSAKNIVVTNVDVPGELPTTVVVNKYMNSPDLIELLVIGNGTAGSTLDMRGMIVKDHSGSMANDGGGKFTFASVPAFEAVKAGTLIVLSSTGTSADTDGSDFSMALSLTDTSLFTGTGTFDISTTEMVSIKAAGTSGAGSVGIIHSLAGGPEAAQFTNAPLKKLIASGTTAAGRGVRALNSTSTIADYNGTDAEGNVAMTAADFGNGNSSGNITFIRQLRGITSVDGTGSATLVNATSASPLNGRNIFRRNTAVQTVSVTVNGSNAGTLAQVKLTVPASFGVPVAGNVSVSGDGAGTPSVSVAGQVITVNGLAVTALAPVTLSLSGLAVPNPTLPTDDGRYPFIVATAGAGGLAEAILSSPVAVVTIPISSLRDVDADGVSPDNGKVVAVEGVCTEENFNNGASTSAYIQEGDFGMNVFYSAGDLALIRGNSYIVTGSVTQFNGLTEVLPAGLSSVVDLGASVQPAPLVISVPDLLANAEAYEGRLVRVSGLNGTGGTWAPSSTKNAQDGAGNPLDIRIQAGSAVTAEPGYPAQITGIFGQFDQSAPRTSGYQIMPRDDADVSGAVVGYDNWAAAYPGIGAADADADGDGASNLLEYATGTIPNSSGSVPAPAVSAAADGTLTVSWPRYGGAVSDPSITSWIIEASSTMEQNSWSTTGLFGEVLTSFSISSNYTITPTDARVFFRLRVERIP